MAHHLIVVEGAHDAAFFGKLLKRRGFKEVVFFDRLVEPWRGLVPRKFPVRENGRLDKIIVYPNFYSSDNGQSWVGIAIAGGGDGKIIDSLRAPIELNNLTIFKSIGIALDVDWKLSVLERFKRFKQILDAWNNEEESEKLTGFPINVPDEPNKVVGTNPRFGVFVFPGPTKQGTLETLILECAEHTLPVISAHAGKFVEAVLEDTAIDPAQRHELLSPSGKQKCQCGVIANVLNPGSNLAAALRGQLLINNDSLKLPCVAIVDAFLESLLGSFLESLLGS